MKFSIVICTYNRSQYLRLNLDAIREFGFPRGQYEVLVVDNNSSDDTEIIVGAYAKDIPNLRYVFEQEQGLSHARNRGYQEASGEYVIYLDDDAIPYSDFMERVSVIEREYNFDAWGGRDIPYYPEGRPAWLKDHYVAIDLNYSRVALLKKHDFFIGCIMVFKKSALEQLGGFDPNFGMKGKGIGYAEETELQIRMKKAGLRLGFDPEWKIKHCMLPHKISITWFFDSAFAMGKYLANMFGIKYSFVSMSKQFLIGFFQVLVLLALRTPRLLFDKDYYIQNWRIDVFRRFAKRLGMIYNGLATDPDSSNGTQTKPTVSHVKEQVL